MPIDRFVLLIVAVIAAAGLTVALAAWLSATLSWPGLGLPLLIPLALAAYVAVRVFGEQRRGSDGD